MKPRFFRIITILAILSVLAAPVGAQTSTQAQGPELSMGALITSDTPQGSQAPKMSNRLIVELTSPPLAVWSKTTGESLTAIGRLDVNSPQAKSYLAQLQNEQTAFINQMRAALPDASVGTYINEMGAQVDLTYKVVLNGMTVDPGNTDLRQARKILSAIPGVKYVYLDYAHDPDLYASLPLINAPVLWNQLGGKADAGKGIKVASMDGGLHHLAPMFDGTGYSYPPGYPPEGLGMTTNNNGKIIASRAYFRSWDPPAIGEDNPWPGPTGTPHGNHTAGIAAGDPVIAPYLGITESISGVAPSAWLMSYKVFYNSVTGDGSFYNAEGIAALEDIARDGADVLNNSWGGGPGSAGGEFDALDQALINVANTGTFVSMSAGNAGPGNGTTDHPSSEYIDVAASTTSGTLAAGRLSVSAPQPISPTLQEMPFGTAQFGEPLQLAHIYNYSYLPSVTVDPTNSIGCKKFPAGSFTGKAALIMRGTCNFSVKVANAQKAGADFAVIFNQPSAGDTIVNMSAGISATEVTIPSVLVGNSKGTRMVTWYDQFGTASEITLNMLAFQAGNRPDVIADFSSRGPSVGNVLKPDIAAPGVNILSQGFTPGATGEARHLGFGQVSGTSMAAPHVAGAAALLRQAHPDWTNAEIKSALMSTSKFVGIFNGDGTPAQPLDMGAGRLDLANAANPGVILDPPSISFGMITTGTVVTQRVMVTSVTTQTDTYELSTQLAVGSNFTVTQIIAPPGFSVSPEDITLAPNASAVVTVTFDTQQSMGIGDNQGYIVLQGQKNQAHLPAWARVEPLPSAEILLIDNDGSSSLGLPDYNHYYTTTLQSLGLTYDVLDVDNLAGPPGIKSFVPDAATLASYKAVIYFTGDNYSPNGSFTVPTPLTAIDQDRLTEYANSGGVIFAMGQDLASVLGSTISANSTFFYSSVLGGSWLQDSLTDNLLPSLPIGPRDSAPKGFHGISLDLSGMGDGAANQIYIDEIKAVPFKDPNNPENLLPYLALLRYPGPFNVEDGTVAMSHRDQPTLERPGISYFGRSIYTTFGLEGVNDTITTTQTSTRADLVGTFWKWAMDEPTLTISNTSPVTNTSGLSQFQANLSSNIPGTSSVSYRWDFGDGSKYQGPYSSKVSSHTYNVCGTYTVRVEVVDSWGNRAIGTLTVDVDKCTTHLIYLPVIAKLAPIE